MAVGDWLSSLAEDGLDHTEREREKSEMETHMSEEMLEMVLIYEAKGLCRADAEELVSLLVENKEAFLNLMCVYELGIMDADTGSSPFKVLVFFCCCSLL